MIDKKTFTLHLVDSVLIGFIAFGSAMAQPLVNSDLTAKEFKIAFIVGMLAGGMAAAYKFKAWWDSEMASSFQTKLLNLV